MKELVSSYEIQAAVDRLAREIFEDYKWSEANREPILLLGVLKGAFVFLSDLVRRLPLETEVDFAWLSSYEGTESLENVRFHTLGTTLFRKKHVIVVEDIVDTGRSLHVLLDLILRQGPLSLKVCTLLNKPSRRKFEVPLDYVGFEIPDVFAIGYGLDYDGRYRRLTGLFTL